MNTDSVKEDLVPLRIINDLRKSLNTDSFSDTPAFRKALIYSIIYYNHDMLTTASNENPNVERMFEVFDNAVSTWRKVGILITEFHVEPEFIYLDILDNFIEALSTPQTYKYYTEYSRYTWVRNYTPNKELLSMDDKIMAGSDIKLV